MMASALNLEPPKYKSGALPQHHPAQFLGYDIYSLIQCYQHFDRT